MIESLSFPFSDTVKILGKYFLPSATTNSFIQSNLTSSTSSTTKNTLKIHDIQKSKPVIFLLSFSFFFPSFQCTRQCWLLLPILDFFLLIFNATALSWLYPSASPVDADSQTNLRASHFSLSHPSHHSPGHHPFFQNNFCSPSTTCCSSSCPSSICPPCGSHRDICKRKIKSCYSPKCTSLLLEEIPMASHHLQSPVRSEPCLLLPSHGVPLSPFSTQQPGLLSESITHKPFPPWGHCYCLKCPSFIPHGQQLGGLWRGFH